MPFRSRHRCMSLGWKPGLSAPSSREVSQYSVVKAGLEIALPFLCAPGRAHSLRGESPLRTLMTGTVS
jgi:hypothetical protein